MALVSAADAWWGGGMALSRTYEPSPSDWVRNQVEKFEASDGQEANTLNGDPIVVIGTDGGRAPGRGERERWNAAQGCAAAQR